MTDRPILISYDGSDHARHAIELAAQLFGGSPAIVVNVWESVATMVPGYPLAGFTGTLEESTAELDRAGLQRAEEVAAEGVEAARAAGFEAEALVEHGDGRTWPAILDVADRRDVAAIVVGRRGVSGIKSLVLGSISNGVVHHAHRPVLVVPAAPDAD